MVCLIGRLSTDINEKDSTMTLAVQSNIKNEEGVYDTYFIDILLYENMLKNSMEYLKKGDLVGIKGRLIIKNNELKVVADKLSFLTSNKVGEE
jgi:single-stranded DNA-binding protein